LDFKWWLLYVGGHYLEVVVSSGLPVVCFRISYYRAFHGFGEAKFPDGDLVLGLGQFLILPQLPPKILLESKVVKIEPKIIISLC